LEPQSAASTFTPRSADSGEFAPARRLPGVPEVLALDHIQIAGNRIEPIAG
jgi:hypothetical protein